MNRSDTLHVDDQVCRLSIIVPTCSNRKTFSNLLPSPARLSRKAQAERAIQSVLQSLASSESPKSEILIVDDEFQTHLAEHIESTFPDQVMSGQLRVIFPEERTGDPGFAKNFGARFAKGRFLTFLDPADRWSHSPAIGYELRKTDLLFSLKGQSNFNPKSADWIQGFLASNELLPSSIVIHRALFEKVGGFPNGYSGLPFPKRIPGVDEYELFLKVLIELSKKDQKDRFRVIPRFIEPSSEDSKNRVQGKLNQIKEVISIGQIASQLPKHYWPYFGKRFMGLFKK